MASVAMLLGGAVVNALAFSGSNYLFSTMRHSDLEAERKRHDLAVEKLQAAHEKWSKGRTERLDWINDQLKREGHAMKTFQDADEAIREYSRVSGKTLSFDPEPVLSDFYTPSPAQKNRELIFIIVAMTAITGGLIIYRKNILKRNK